jgi:hypothetical protein
MVPKLRYPAVHTQNTSCASEWVSRDPRGHTHSIVSESGFANVEFLFQLDRAYGYYLVKVVLIQVCCTALGGFVNRMYA